MPIKSGSYSVNSRTIRETYPTVYIQGQKVCKCASCGKRLKRAMTFDQTLNPWNRLPDGRVKEPEDIYSELEAQRKAWMEEPELCQKCKEAPRHA
jgi:hypothetical protein